MKHQHEYLPSDILGASGTRRRPSSSSSPLAQHPRCVLGSERNEVKCPTYRVLGSQRRSSEGLKEILGLVIDDALALIDESLLSMQQEQQEQPWDDETLDRTFRNSNDDDHESQSSR